MYFRVVDSDLLQLSLFGPDLEAGSHWSSADRPGQVTAEDVGQSFSIKYGPALICVFCLANVIQ